MKNPITKFFEWVFNPMGELSGDCQNQTEPVIITPEIPPVASSVSIYRPLGFNEYIGQQKAKDKLQTYIKGIKERNLIFPHLLIYGKAGCGKTTLARIVANELGVKFQEVITANISDIEILKYYIIQANKGIIFLDEIHSLPRDIAERIYTIMEDFKDNNKPIQPFTLVGATTELGELIKNRNPFVARFKIKIELEDYNYQELEQIAKQYKDKMFKSDNISDIVYEIIAKNCRYTPRLAINLLEETIYSGNIETTLKNNNIIKNGYTYKDLKVLKYLAQNEKGIGLNGLAAYLETSTKNFQYEIEGLLIKNELITRGTRGRKITNKGLDLIKELEK